MRFFFKAILSMSHDQSGPNVMLGKSNPEIVSESKGAIT